MNSPPVASRRPRPRGRPSRIRLWHVSLACLATGLVLLAVAVCSLSAATSDQDRLLVDGAPVRAWVVEAPADSGFDLPGTYRPANSILISYEFDGRDYRARLTLNDESPRLRPGDDLAVRLDPTDPGHVAAEDFDNQPAWVVDLEIWALVLGLTLVVVGSICQAVAVRVRRRSRRRTLSA